MIKTTFLAHSMTRLMLIAVAAISISGCSLLRDFQPSVSIQPITSEEYISQRRGDILTTGQLSAQTQQTIHVTGLDLGPCATPIESACTTALATMSGISDERRFSTLSELWLQRAMRAPANTRVGPNPDAALDLWLETVRYAYAYLFFTPRTPGERAFEDRQTQVRDWYNYAVQQATTLVFAVRSQQSDSPNNTWSYIRLGDWKLHVASHVRLPEGVDMPQELLPASSLAFRGLRSVYRRDGLGAELVTVFHDDPVTAIADPVDTPDDASDSREGNRTRPPAWSEMPSPNMTVLFQFNTQDLDQLLQTRDVFVSLHDPLVEREISLHGQRIPLAGNYTAGYGVWLARSGFNRQSLRSLLGRERGIDRPHLYMMQPFDPNRRVIVMLHGLASSPEAWVNVANEIMGDTTLRREFQVWQVYYPTNKPVFLNHAAIRRLLHEVLNHVDPDGKAAASNGIVLVGHSMGGMISRLMISTADDQLWNWALAHPDVQPDRLMQLEGYLDPLLSFQPFPGIERVVFIATPHRGTAVANQRLARWMSSFIRLPLTILENIDDSLRARAEKAPVDSERILRMLPTSIDNLNQEDSFVQAAADLPISSEVRYHSIIARVDPDGPLEDSDDGLVPYWSAHLPGAESEKIIVSGHSVQETAAAILELRRILHEDIAQYHRSNHISR